MKVAEVIRSRLRDAFDPRELEVSDDSAAHAGHAGAPAGGESHFSVRIRAGRFAEMSRIQRHREVQGALGRDLMGRIHALAIDVDG